MTNERPDRSRSSTRATKRRDERRALPARGRRRDRRSPAARRCSPHAATTTTTPADTTPLRRRRRRPDADRVDRRRRPQLRAQPRISRGAILFATPRSAPACPRRCSTGTGTAGRGRPAARRCDVHRSRVVAAICARDRARTRSRTSPSCAPRSARRRWRSPRSTSAAAPTGAFSAAARAAGLVPARRDVRSLCQRRELPARRLHLRGCRRHRLQGRGAADHQQDLSRGGGRHPRGGGLSCRAGPHRAVPQGPRPTPSLIAPTPTAISNARDSLDGAQRHRPGHRPGTGDGIVEHRARPTATASRSAAPPRRCSTSSTSTRPRASRAAGSSRRASTDRSASAAANA